MVCVLEFPKSFVKMEFCSKGNKQKILIDILTKYTEVNFDDLASVLGVSVKKLKNIGDGKNFLVGERADSLAQLFLMFLGQHFLRKCVVVRHFTE